MENLEKYLQKHAGFLGQGKMSVKEEQVFGAWKKKSLKKIRTLLSVLAKNKQCKTISQVINRQKTCR